MFVTEQATKRPDGLPVQKRHAGVSVPEVVNSPFFQAGVPMDASLRLLKVGRC